MAIKPENITIAKEKFEELLEAIDFNVSIPCDFVLDIEDLDVNFIRTIDQYNWLWGTGVKEPKVAITNIQIQRKDVHVQGKNFNSVAFMVDDIKFVQFNMTEDNPLLEWASAWDGEDDDKITLTVVGEASINEYQGQLTPQVIISDLTVQN